MSRYGYNYGYTYRDGPLLRWGHGMPVESRAADTLALGSLSGPTLAGSSLDGPTLLPAPGAPEIIGVTGRSMMPVGGQMPMGGCSCSGSCGCGGKSAVGDLVDSVPGGYLGLGAIALLTWHLLKKRRR